MLVIAVVACGLFGVASAQRRIVHIAPTAFGILNETIAGDTIVGGERIDSSTVYELERGPLAYYTLNGTIEHSGYHLTIVAEDGDGERPKLVPGVLTGGEVGRCFRARGDLTLKGLYLTNVDQEGSIYSTKNIVRASGEGIRVIIDDCHFNGDHQSFVRLDSDYQKYYITNSIFSWSVDNGRGLDRRGNITDSLVVENCTFYNLISEVMREGDSGYLRYVKYDHCTFYNIGGGFMEFEQVGELVFTNNLIVNAGFLGESPHYEDPLKPIMEGIDTVSHRELDSLLTLEGKTQTLEFRNNNFYLDPAIVAAHASLTLPDSLVADGVLQRAIFDSLGLTLIDTSTMTREAITFTNVPRLDTTLSIITTVWEEWGGDSDYQSPFDHGGVGDYGETGFGTLPFDFTYPTTTACYTAGDGNTPLGDLNWFPEFLAVEDRGGAQVPDAYRLSQNYPNPFNPTTIIQYELPHAADMHLTVYNLLGKEVVRLEYGHQEAGIHTTQWNGRDAAGSMVSSGVYFYRLQAEGFTQTRKMLLLR